jgi:UDP-N-acetylmuramyl pentapeptide synthase
MGMNNFGEIKEMCETFEPLGGSITNIGDAHI